MKRLPFIVIALGVALAVAAGYLYLRFGGDQSKRSGLVRQWILDPQSHSDWAVRAGEHCGGAPFAFPSAGFIGYLWRDTFQANHPHTGIDLFAGTAPNVTPVYAVYDGYLTRLADWKSTVIIRIPSDPLHPGAQIWTYYTHMADVQGNSTVSSDFPQGTSEVFVKAGTLLGYQGNYSGTPGSPTGVHLHFSIVKSDASGSFTNESLIQNTLDPSPYFGLDLNAVEGSDEVIVCKTD